MQNPSTDFGEVISVRGSQARIGIKRAGRSKSQYEIRATVGRFLSISSGQSSDHCDGDRGLERRAAAKRRRQVFCDRFGRPARRNQQRHPARRASSAASPSIRRSAIAANPIGNQELRTVYARAQNDAIHVGALQQDPSINAYVDVDEMLSKHFAVLGIDRRRQIERRVAAPATRSWWRGRICASSCSTSTTNTAAASATARW